MPKAETAEAVKVLTGGLTASAQGDSTVNIFRDDARLEVDACQVDFDIWTCRFDNLGTTKEGGIDVRLQAVA